MYKLVIENYKIPIILIANYPINIIELSEIGPRLVVNKMRIDAFNKISELYKAQSVKSTSKVKNASFRDTVEISKTAKDYNVAKQIVANTPDIREAKVNEIKQRMEAGTYHVKLEDVAEKILDRTL